MKYSSKYPLKPFQDSDPSKLRRVIAEYPLATVISQTKDFPLVSQIPLIYHPTDNALRGHVDRNNPHCDELRKGENIYCIFNGPNHYISPSIYPDTQYPGWNYVAVHVEGRVRAFEDKNKLTDLLLETASHNEPEDSGYNLSPSQENFHRLVQYILGFEIEISDIRGVLKLAQDKGPKHAGLAKDHLSKVVQQDISDFLEAMLS
ncbi:MAG: FMN-binding negative transcriptional regulator [Pseudomonadota bacterium]